MSASEGHVHQAVAQRFAKLPAGWTVLRGLSTRWDRRSHDHLVIGPPGVYACMSRYLDGTVQVHARRFRLDGRPRQDYAQVMAAAARIRQRLEGVLAEPVDLEAVLVIVGADVRVVRQPDHLTVVHVRDVRQWLEGQPPRLTATDVDVMTRAAVPLAEALVKPGVGMLTEPPRDLPPS